MCDASSSYVECAEIPQAGLTVMAKGLQLWNVGAGLPLDALKKGTIVEWTCSCAESAALIARCMCRALGAMRRRSHRAARDGAGTGYRTAR